MFENKTRYLVDQNILFRSHKVAVGIDDVTYTERMYEWDPTHLYEIEFDVHTVSYVDQFVSYDSSIHFIIPSDDVIFYQGDKLLCMCAFKLHSVNGLPDAYVDYDAIRYQFYNIISESPDTMFGEVIKLNELEYLDYLYG